MILVLSKMKVRFFSVSVEAFSACWTGSFGSQALQRAAMVMVLHLPLADSLDLIHPPNVSALNLRSGAETKLLPGLGKAPSEI